MADPTTPYKYTVRVERDDVYEMYFLTTSGNGNPLASGVINDLSANVFAKICKNAVIVQLISIQNNPGKA